MVADSFQVARVSFLKFQPVETRLRRSFVPGLNEVPGDVDSDNVGAHTGQRNRGCAISAAEVQSPQRRRDPERLNDCFSGLTHERGNLGKVAFFPQRFVWIHAHSLLFGLPAHLIAIAVSPLQATIVQCACGNDHARASP